MVGALRSRCRFTRPTQALGEGAGAHLPTHPLLGWYLVSGEQPLSLHLLVC